MSKYIRCVLALLAGSAVVLLPCPSSWGEIVIFDDVFADNAFADAAEWIGVEGGAPQFEASRVTGHDLGTEANYSLHDEGKRATLLITFDNPITDTSGPDIVIYEAGAPEEFELAVGETGSFHTVPSDALVWKGAFTRRDPDDTYAVNAARLDLLDFGLQAGGTTTVLRLRLTDTAASGSADILAIGTCTRLTFFSGTGHYYGFVHSPVSWPEAKAAAEAVSYLGVQGHLVTVMSPAENAFVLNAFRGQGANSSSWIGGFQPSGSPEPGGDWQWVTGEPWGYANWNSTEPNDSAGEDCLAINLTDYPGLWADYHGGLNPEEQLPVVNSSYIVEYDALWPMETVFIGDPGNTGEWSGESYGGNGPDRICGAVSYEYNIGKYEVTAGQYCEFLSKVATTDTHGVYDTRMWSSDFGCKIQRSGSSGSYTYGVASDYANRPVNFVSFWDSCRFANWLSNGQLTAAQDPTTTEHGAYTLDGYNGQDGRTIQRNPGATWAVTSEDEWYKAAYYKGGSTNAGYWDYPTSSDTVPGQDMTEATNPGNNANYYTAPYAYPIDSGKYTTVAGEFELSDSPYGTFDQGGNVFEWNEAIVYQGEGYAYRGLRGGCFINYGGFSGTLHASDRDHSYPSTEDCHIGFRVSEVPEPATLTVNSGSGDGSYRPRMVVNISADAPVSGKAFDKWIGNTSGIADVNASSTTLTMPAAAQTVTATYVNVYALTVNSGSGDGTYRQGDIVPIWANPDPSGYQFDRWVGDTSGIADVTAMSTTLTMPAADQTVTATYVNVCTLTVNSGSGDGTYLCGSLVPIQADLAPSGFVFHQWVGDTEGLDPQDICWPRPTYTMPCHDAEVTATYWIPGDLSGDDFVGQGDLNIVLAQWGRSGAGITDPRADANYDNFVGQGDLNIVLANWGKGVHP